MELKDEILIHAPREAVFAALNDPDVLTEVIPGCQALEKITDNEFTATVVTKVGPVKTTFKGEVTLSDIIVPESYTISGGGKAGPAGFAKGSARVRLEEDPEGTRLTYEITAEVGGKLAQLLNDARSAVTVNSTAAQQVLWRGIPIKVFGDAVYAKPEFVSTQPLPEFFAQPTRPDNKAYKDYRRYLLETSQLPGGRKGRDIDPGLPYEDLT